MRLFNDELYKFRNSQPCSKLFTTIHSWSSVAWFYDAPDTNVPIRDQVVTISDKQETRNHVEVFKTKITGGEVSIIKRSDSLQLSVRKRRQQKFTYFKAVLMTLLSKQPGTREYECPSLSSIRFILLTFIESLLVCNQLAAGWLYAGRVELTKCSFEGVSLTLCYLI